MSNATNIALALIQQHLVVPKNQYNSFGKYHYRSCEAIMEAVKPLLAEYSATLTVRDDLELIGERYYVKATATLCSTEADATPVSVTAYARESLDKKGWSIGYSDIKTTMRYVHTADEQILSAIIIRSIVL